MSTREFDVAVAGAGVIGLACALEEARRGAKVLVADARGVGGGASGAAAGLVVTRNPRRFFSPFREFVSRSASIFPAWVEELRAISGLPLPFSRSPALHLYHFAEAQGKKNFEEDVSRLFRENAFDYEIIHGVPAEVRGLLKANGWAAIRFREELAIDPIALLEGLKAACGKLGVELWPSAPVEFPQEAGGGVQFQAGGKAVRARHFIIAAGAESDRLLAGFNLKPVLIPVKGQAFLVHNIYGLTFPLHYNQRLFLAPRGDFLYAGTTKEKGEWDSSYKPQGEWSLREDFGRWLKIPLPSAVKPFSGLRPRTRDRLPLIGFVTPSKAVSICAGHYKSGVALAALSAKSLSSLIHGEPAPFDLSPFDPLRALKTTLP